MENDLRELQEIQRLNRIKEKNDCLVCEIVITKEFKEAPISIIQGNFKLVNILIKNSKKKEQNH